jgi:hypothetical protein
VVREVRRVPKDWQHPKNERGHYRPLHGRSYAAEVAEWDEEYAQWKKGFRRGYGDEGKWIAKDLEHADMPFSEWHGRRPDEADYMPDWPESERTYLQMYENTSEGTPISPVMETAEELARWLADTSASSFASMTATYEQWLSTIRRGWAVGAMASAETGLVSGVEGLASK